VEANHIFGVMHPNAITHIPVSHHNAVHITAVGIEGTLVSEP
jgi:hypothetical protein